MGIAVDLSVMIFFVYNIMIKLCLGILFLIVLSYLLTFILGTLKKCNQLSRHALISLGLCMVVAVYQGGAKNLSSNRRITRSVAEDIPILNMSGDISADTDNSVTNLQIIGFSNITNGVYIKVAWPSATAITALDVYATDYLESNRWQIVAYSVVTNGGTFFLPFALFSRGDADKGFFTIGSDNDYDGDGLTDRYEALISHTDPSLSDSDTDGIEDGFEVMVLGSDPNSGNGIEQPDPDTVTEFLMSSGFLEGVWVP